MANAPADAAAPLQLGALQEELSTAITREWERQAVDDMKKRAIVSATSYDEFKNLVACATQKPLARDDFAKKSDVAANKAVKKSSSGGSGLGGLEALLGGGRSSATYAPDASVAAAGGAARALSKLAGGAAATSSGPGGSSATVQQQVLVRTPGEFDREWRRARRVGAARVDAVPEEELFYGFLLSVSPVPETVAVVFKAELDGEVLARMLKAAVWAAELPASERKQEAATVSVLRSSGGVGSSDAGADAADAEGAAVAETTAAAPASSATRLSPLTYLLRLLLEVSKVATGFGLAWDLLAPPEQSAFRRGALPAAEAALGGDAAAAKALADAFA